MKKTSLALFMAFLPFLLFSQKIKTKFKNALEPNGDLISAGPNYTLEEIDESYFILKRFYPENAQMTHYMTFKTINLRVRDGQYEEYYDDGTLVCKGIYKDNKKEGDWIENVNSKGAYQNDQRIGKWIELFENQKIVFESNYVAGELHGKRIAYDDEGNIIDESEYNMGELVSGKGSGKYPDLLPMFLGCESLEGDPVKQKECSDKKMLEYIYSNITYPSKARKKGIEGEALFRFVIAKDGSLKDLQTLRGISKEIKQECLRMIKDMPKWHPGLKDGVPVKVQYNLPIRFRLE